MRRQVLVQWLSLGPELVLGLGHCEQERRIFEGLHAVTGQWNYQVVTGRSLPRNIASFQN